MSGFKFDFSPPAAGGNERASAPAGFDSRGQPSEDANNLIAKMVDRSDGKSDACTFIDASSRIMTFEEKDDDPGGGTVCGDEEMKPHLRFHSSGRVELHSADNGMAPLRYVLPKHALSDDTTDLIPGVYEGGLKVWECSVDLCRFLAVAIDELSVDAASSDIGGDGGCFLDALRRALAPGGSTMELGCGHGLPGCLILRENIRRTLDRDRVGAARDGTLVLFGDFNDFVLLRATIPNARMNVRGLLGKDGTAVDEIGIARALTERSVFAGGDWMGLSRRLWSGDVPFRRKREKGEFRLDLVLASETTYTAESCRDTAFLMLRHLKIDVGVGVVSTKRFYFGVGGGTGSFKAACETLSACDREPYSRLRLCVRTVQSFDTGNANIRDIMLVKCKRK